MGLVLKYARLTKAGTWQYRRRIPTKLRDFLTQGEFKRYLGSTEREALKNFPKVDAEFERLVAAAHRRASRLSDTSLSPLDVHREAERLARELAQGTVTIGGRTLPASDPDAADILRDSYFSQLPQDNETGEPVGEPDINGRAVSILANGGRLARPEPTLADAKRLYVRERITGDINETAKLNRIERVMDYLSHAIDATRPLSSLTREDARDVRDHMLRDLDMRPATVKRYMNDIRALVSFGITEYGLRDASNPFIRLPVKTEISVQEERSPIPEATLRAIRSQLANHAGPTLLRIWRMLEGTGCRLGEVSGLLVADVVLDGAIPYLNLVHHPHRRLKTAGSVRRVPLIGEALEAAQEAVDAAEGGTPCSPDMAVCAVRMEPRQRSCGMCAPSPTIRRSWSIRCATTWKTG